MIRSGLIILFLFLFGFANAQVQVQQQHAAHAGQLIKKGKFKSASKYLSKCIRNESQYPEYFYLRGWCYWDMGQRQMGLDDMTWAVKLQPDSLKYLASYATFLDRMTFFERAEKAYERCLPLAKTRKDSANIYASLGNETIITGDTANGMLLLEKCLSMDSMNYTGLNDYALALNDKGRSAEGITYLLRALTVDSTDQTLITNIGYCYSTMGEYAKAIPYFNRCIRQDPKDAIAWDNRGYCKLKLGDLNGAMADVQYSLKLFPQNSYAYRNLGLIYLAMNDGPHACQAFQQALDYKFTETYGNEVVLLRNTYCR